MLWLPIPFTIRIVSNIIYRKTKTSTNIRLDGPQYDDTISIGSSTGGMSSIKWLKGDLNLIIPTEQIYFGCGYLTFVGGRLKTGNSLLDSKSIIGCTVDSPEKNSGWLIMPIRTMKETDERSLGALLTTAINSNNSEYLPSDSYETLLNWVKDNLHSDFYISLKSTNVCSPFVMTVDVETTNQ
ncbi:unnamed protein product [Adineta ricciae]|uniref:Uncharacterized protein n=1 Tax=Adineta ricciae TaxID=249248 RepID=A0A815UAZ3_ADIRI|nr:unnamed protein product [Adineta ricciae]CAF1658612.1 unnamed protein product [Adineta ricciae]